MAMWSPYWRPAPTANGYKITKDSLSGYASADYITINARYDTDGDFEAYLTAQGFPESYKPALRQLHAAHPQWIFKAKSLTMTFDTALTNEARIGRNNIQNPEAWRSMGIRCLRLEQRQLCLL